MAKKEEFSLLINDRIDPIDQRNLVEETLSSEGSMEYQRQNLGANLARQALQHFLHLPDGALSTRERSRSPRGEAVAAVAADAGPIAPIGAVEESDMPQAF